MRHLKSFYESKQNSDFFSDEDNMQYYISIPDDAEMKEVTISDLIGKTVIDIVWSEHKMIFECLDEELNSRIYYVFEHEQDCCESVWLDDIVGDLEDLFDKPILKAVEKTSSEEDDELPKADRTDESHTWTFYTLATIKGYVDLRWYGCSNGYYSERVDIYKFTKNY